MSEKRTYTVTIPIGGHAIISVEATNEDEAKEIAMDSVTNEHLETWDCLERINRGNVCYFPQPWEIEVIEE